MNIDWFGTLVVIVAVTTLAALVRRDRHAGPAQNVDEKDNLEQVKLLFDYTKFHITVYATLAGLLLTLSSQPPRGALGPPR